MKIIFSNALKIYVEKVKRAGLFSALTGLRFCDIKNLKWGDLQGTSGKISKKKS